MPQAILVATVITAAQTGLALAAGGVITGSIVTWAGTAFAKNLVIQLLLGAASKSRQPNLNAESQQRKQTVRSSIAARQIVYGRARISGPLVYTGSTGSTNEYLHMVVPIHHGELDAIETVYLNDLPSSDSRFSGFLRVKTYVGTSDQAADADLIAESPDWSADHRLRGIGYLYLRLLYDSTAYANGIPNPSAVVRGRKVYDPRTGITAWSNNPALCVLDYLTGTANGEPVGIGADMTEIDIDTFVSAASICDEQVTIKAGGTHARYTCDGVVTMDASPAAVMEQLLTCCGGALIYAGGKYRLFVGASTPVSRTLTADILRGDVSYRPYASKRDSSNGVKGTYIDPLNAYEASDFPAQSVAAYVTEDGGEERWLDLALPYTLDGVRAQRLARQFLERNRRGAEIELRCNFSALGLAVWDCVAVDIPALGLTANKWRVKGWTFAQGGGIDVTLQEESDDSYVWSTADEVTPEAIPYPTMVRSNEVAPPTNVTVSSSSYITPEGSAVGGLLVEWTQAADAFVSGYEIQYSEAGAEDWQSGASVGKVTSAQVSLLEVGQAYDIRIRSARAGGALSPWVTVTNTTVSGDASAPAAPSSVVATAESAAIKIDWLNPMDDDFRLARLYRHTSNDSGAATAIADIYGLPGQAGTFTDPVASGQTRYYWLRARDISGNLGVFSSGVSETSI
jgi:hypothetical protein